MSALRKRPRSVGLPRRLAWSASSSPGLGQRLPAARRRLLPSARPGPAGALSPWGAAGSRPPPCWQKELARSVEAQATRGERLRAFGPFPGERRGQTDPAALSGLAPPPSQVRSRSSPVKARAGACPLLDEQVK